MTALDAFLATFAFSYLAMAIRRVRIQQATNQRENMIELDNLEASIRVANAKLEDLQADVDRLIGTVDPSVAPRVGDAALAVTALGNAMAELSARIELTAPTP